jgi:hypothetical protein
MRRVPRSVVVLSVLGVALMVAVPASATRGQPTKELPFTVYITGYTDHFIPAGPNFPFDSSLFGGRCSVLSNWVIGMAGSGEAARLGDITWSVEHCSQFTPTGPNMAGHGTYTDGLVTYVADNGDELYFTHTGSFDIVDGVSYITGTGTITGGTGRFAGASGTILESGFQPLASDFLQVWNTGTIVYDASMRSG